jgi:hypothetical protein
VHNLNKIAVLVHANDDFEGTPYLLSHFIRVWKESGIEVRILRGTGSFEPADALILHVDLTVIPEEYIDFCRRYPLVINGRVRDISKRRISSNIIERNDAYNGPVIVKTDANIGGLKETGLEDSLRNRLQKLFVRKRWHIPWGIVSFMRSNSYPVYSNRDEVPRTVWKNRNLVVEKYLPEMEGDLYCLRQWIFFGNREFNQRLFSHCPIIKGSGVIKKEILDPAPAALREMRMKLGFDYGKFDYALVNGEVILYDANRTPTLLFLDKSQTHSAIVTELSKGLQGFSEAPGPTAGKAQGMD